MSEESISKPLKENSVAPMELAERRGEEEEKNNVDKAEEMCIGFWRQTRLRRKKNEPGECFGIRITIHKH